jgi:type III pantothenate kinase
LEIDGMISHYKTEFENLHVLLTGGDAFHLASQLKNSIFANQNLVLEGLESIMTINLD